MSFKRSLRDRGASAVEYGLLIAGIAAVVAVVVFGLGSVTGEKLSDDCAAIGGAIENSLHGSTSTGCP